MSRSLLVGVIFFLCTDVVFSQVLNAEFTRGMSYELDGRATMHALTANMARRTADPALRAYWRAYHRLEEFSRPRYEEKARELGIALPNPRWVAAKARMFSWLPGFLFSRIMGDLRSRTIVYVDTLRRLAELGPAEGQAFYAYMVRQELLQVRLMDLALAGDYLAAEPLVAGFIAQESAMLEQEL